MSYTFNKTIKMPMLQAVEYVTQKLKDEGFGIITDINMQETMKKKLNKDIPAYRILGACNPQLALQAITHEPLIGTMLPCNVVVRELSPNECEVAIIDPVASMLSIKNPNLSEVSQAVQLKLKTVAEKI